MSAASVLARGRAAAEALMVDACVIRHRTGHVTNPTTGVTTPTYSAVYTGACRIQQSAQGTASTPADAGEAHLMLVPLVVQVPMSVIGVAEGDEVTITASVHDADLVGRVFRVRHLAHKSHMTARRLGVEEVS